MTEHKNAEAALLAAQGNFAKVKKDAENTHFKNKYSTLSALLEATLPALSANGLLVSQPPISDEFGHAILTRLVHPESGTEISCQVPLLLGKQDMQNYKSASTYARRIGLENLTGVSAGEDDDAETDRNSNTMGAAINDAWRQGVMDNIPEGATPRQTAEAFADAICADFNGKGEKALQNRWNKHKQYIKGFEGRFPDLHEKVVDAFENQMIDIQSEKEQA